MYGAVSTQLRRFQTTLLTLVPAAAPQGLYLLPSAINRSQALAIGCLPSPIIEEATTTVEELFGEYCPPGHNPETNLPLR